MAIDTISAGLEYRARKATRGMLYRSWLIYRAWFINRRTRRSLLELTEDQLRDIGISRSDAQREVAKSFYWD